MRVWVASAIMLAVVGGQLTAAYTACKALVAAPPSQESLPAHCAGMVPDEPTSSEDCAELCGRTWVDVPVVTQEDTARSVVLESGLPVCWVAPERADVQFTVRNTVRTEAHGPPPQAKIYLLDSCFLI